MQRVLVIGSGDAGTAILNALTRRSNHIHASLLVRPESVEKHRDKLASFQAAGVQVIQGSLSSSLEHLTALLRETVEEGGNVSERAAFDVVISCISHERYRTDQVKLVQAAKAAGVKRYFPTAFGMDEEAVGSPSAFSPIIEAKLKNFAAIAEVGLPYTIVSCGFWSEWLLSRLLGIDYSHKVITAIETFDSRISTTTLKDLGELMCEILLDPSTIDQTRLHIASDRVTLEQVAQAVERATGSTFERRLATMEEMDKRRAAAVFPRMDVQAVFLTLIHNQRGMWWPKERTWNETHPISYQVTKFNECAEKVIKSGEHLKPSEH